MSLQGFCKKEMSLQEFRSFDVHYFISSVLCIFIYLLSTSYDL